MLKLINITFLTKSNIMTKNNFITPRTWSSALVIIIVPKVQIVLSLRCSKFMMNSEDS